MKSMMKLSAIFFCLALAACGGDENNGDNNGNNGSNNGGSNNGSNNGGSNNGGSNNGGSNNGGSNNGGSNNGGGDIAIGGDCSPNDTCTDGWCAITDAAADPCAGVCTAFQPVDESCGATEICEPALACNFGTMVCVTRGAEGEACAITTCETDLYCAIDDAVAQTGLCAARIADGEACPGFTGCDTGLWCDFQTDAQNPVCDAQDLGDGEDCTARTGACMAPLFCDTQGDNTCKEFEAPVCP